MKKILLIIGIILLIGILSIGYFLISGNVEYEFKEPNTLVKKIKS